MRSIVICFNASGSALIVPYLQKEMKYVREVAHASSSVADYSVAASVLARESTGGG